MRVLPASSILSRHRWNAGELVWLGCALACFYVFPD